MSEEFFTPLGDMDKKDKSKELKSRKTGRLLVFVLLFISVASLSFSAFLAARMDKMKKDAENASFTEVPTPDPDTGNPDTVYTAEEMNKLIAEAREEARKEGISDLKKQIKDVYSGGAPVVSMLRSLYPEDIVYYDKGGYVFCPIDESLPMSSVSYDDITFDETTGLASYAPGGENAGHMGIDISKYQQNVDWKEVKKAGVEFVMIRIGIRGYGTGALVMDESFEDNIKGATKAGLKVGVYFFSQATSETEALEEASFVLNAIEKYKVTYPVAIDIEAVNDSAARTANLTAAERTDYTIAFLEAVKAEGYTPLIYGNTKSFCGMLDMSRLSEYDKWFAFYDTEVYFPYEIKMWQYSEKGSVPGIKGDVDFNITFDDSFDK